jgi:carboxyl-terminal processing protease
MNFRYTTIFQMYAFDFVQHKRNKWESINSFKETFKITDELFNQFITYAENELDFKAEEKGIKQSEKIIRRTLKAEIARQLWEEQGYYSVMNDFDKEVEKCMEVMK